MRRLEILLAAAGLALAAAFIGAAAEGAEKLPHLGYVWIGAEGSDDTTIKGLRQGLADFGYVEGRNIAIEYRYADDDTSRLPGLVAELVTRKVDVLLTPGTVAARAAKAANAGIPIVAVTGDPVGAGLVESLARPGGSVTGEALGFDEQFAEKWSQLLLETVPDLKRIAILYNAGSSGDRQFVKAITAAAARQGIAAVGVGVVGADDLESAFGALAASHAGGFVVTGDPLLIANRQRIIAFAAERRLPAVYGLGEYVDDGGLISYAPSIFGTWRRAARYVDRILKGAKPAELPMEQPTEFALKVNLKTAKALGIAIPHLILLRADEVIE